MPSIPDILESMRRNPRDVPFRDVCKVCDCYFGTPRSHGTGHRVYRTPWPGNPRVNIQRSNGKARAYQVRQVLRAISLPEQSYGKTR